MEFLCRELSRCLTERKEQGSVVIDIGILLVEVATTLEERLGLLGCYAVSAEK